MDRRIQKSKKAIMDALVELMDQKEFGKITINEIAEKANVNRGTIYLHYVDKYALLNECVDVSLTYLAEHCAVESNTPDAAKKSMLKTFEYMENNAFLYTTLLKSRGTSIFRDKLTEMMSGNFEKQIVMNGINGDIPKDILIQFFSSATASVLEWWFTNTIPYSAEAITEYLWCLLERNQLVPVTNE